MEFIELIEEMEDAEAVLPIGRVIRDRINPFDAYDDDQFMESFRLSKGGVHFLTNLLRNNLTPLRERRGVIATCEHQVWITLSYYGSSSFMRVVGDFLGFRKSTISRCVTKATFAITTLRRQYIGLPTGQELIRVKQDFHRVAGIPGTSSVLN